MTNEQLKKEFSRWVDNEQGLVWYKGDSVWMLIATTWSGTGHYITNDKHQELRRLEIDIPETKFEFYNINYNWVEAKPQWNPELEYRVKVEPVYEWIFYRVNIDKKIVLSGHVTHIENDQWIKIEETKRKVK